MMRNILFLLVFCLIACTTTQGFKIQMDSYLGASKADLIRDFRGQGKSYSDGAGTEYIEFVRERNFYMPSTASTTTTFSGSQAFSNTVASGGHNIEGYCKVRFALIDNKVARWDNVGNDCTKF